MAPLAPFRAHLRVRREARLELSDSLGRGILRGSPWGVFSEVRQEGLYLVHPHGAMDAYISLHVGDA